MTSDLDPPLIVFAEKVLDLLDDSAYSSTYKYALVLAMLDTCRADTGPAQASAVAVGSAPSRLAMASIARSVTELYWQQADPASKFKRRKGTHLALQQNAGSQARIVSLIVEFRKKHGLLDRRYPVSYLYRNKQHQRLLAAVEWTLVQMPVRFLQRSDDRFLFQTTWDWPAKAKAYRDTSPHYLELVGDAGSYLLRLAKLLRPLVERGWAARVARLNGLEDASLEEFLFGVSRKPPKALAAGLRALQGQTCFYCDNKLQDGKVAIDHFVPWSYAADDAIHNLVVACSPCNAAKSAHPASAAHVAVWAQRFTPDADSKLEALADKHLWQHDRDRTLGNARAFYTVPLGKLMWEHGAGLHPFAAPERDAIAIALDVPA